MIVRHSKRKWRRNLLMQSSQVESFKLTIQFNCKLKTRESVVIACNTILISGKGDTTRLIKSQRHVLFCTHTYMYVYILALSLLLNADALFYLYIAKNMIKFNNFAKLKL